MEDMPVFKSYLRDHLELLLELKKAQDDGNTEKAKEILDKIIANTQKGIED